MPARMTRVTLSTLLAVLAAVGIAALVVTAFRPRPVPVEVASVVLAPMHVTVDEEGRTRVRNVYTVSTPVAGRVLRSPVKAGDLVEARRTVLAVVEEMAPAFLDARTRREVEAQLSAGQAAVDLAGAELRQAEAELAFSKSELERASQLVRNRTIAERTHDRAKVDVDTKTALVARAMANLEVRRRELETLNARLTGPASDPAQAGRDESSCCLTILAPVSGRILKRLQESEKVLASGTPLVEIGDVGDLELVVELLTTDAVKIREGAVARIEAWGGPKALSARVRRIEPAGFTKVSALGIEEQRVNVVLDFETPVAERRMLGHDYRVFVRIEAWRSDEALQVPLSALFRDGAQWSVYVAGDGRAHKQAVEIGQRNTEAAQVLSGLAAGQQVILHPSDRVRDRVRVQLRLTTAGGSSMTLPWVSATGMSERIGASTLMAR